MLAEELSEFDRYGSHSILSRIYRKPNPDEGLDEGFIELDEGFIELCAGSFGYSPDQAKNHFELLKKLPVGFEYFGQGSKKYAQKQAEENPNLEIVENLVLDQNGKPVEGVVVVCRKIQPNIANFPTQ
ncbi:hypothetical protein M1437_02730 [Patescibacteria group bacterium]|nr:hypothetical protein [Patescibacteria group bacterium]